MAPLSKAPASGSIHSLCIGDNGAGKTGALAALVAAGYRLRIMAFEPGYEIIGNLLREAGWSDEKIDEYVDVELCMDKRHIQPVSGYLKAVDATAIPKALNLLAKWSNGEKPIEWGTDTIFCLDTMTSQGRACIDYVWKMKGKLSGIDKDSNLMTQPDWGDAMKLQEDMMGQIAMLPCHVIVNAHVTFVTPDGEASNQGFPSALGSKLPPKIGGYFNHILYFTKEGVGNNKKRIISAKGTGLVGTKTSAPGIVKETYPLDPASPLKGGLRGYFEDIRGPLKPAA